MIIYIVKNVIFLIYLVIYDKSIHIIEEPNIYNNIIDKNNIYNFNLIFNIENYIELPFFNDFEIINRNNIFDKLQDFMILPDKRNYHIDELKLK